MSDLARLKREVDETINLADERRYFGASVKYQRALEAEVERLRAALESVASTYEQPDPTAITVTARLNDAYDMRCIARTALEGSPS